MVMKTNDYVKYLTQQFVKYYDQPKDERKKIRLERKVGRPDLVYHWFGVLPFALSMLFKKKASNN
jgi:YqzE-like protein